MLEQPKWRSLLFVPANVERYVAKAHTRGADAIVLDLDLEDSILPHEKETSRRLILQQAKRVRQGGAEVIVRVNRPEYGAMMDIMASASSTVSCFMIPKCESPHELSVLATLLEGLENQLNITPGWFRLFPLIESAKGLNFAFQIAAAHPRVVAIALGTEDFCANTGIVPNLENLNVPKRMVILAARAAGILPIGLFRSVALFDNNIDFLQSVKYAKESGSTGALTIHPAQIPILNEGFTPSEQEINEANELVEAYKRAGVGVFSHKGYMVDSAVVKRALHVISGHSTSKTSHNRSQ
jgi:citrate lyase subunit beta/citryl-CoA lyase